MAKRGGFPGGMPGNMNNLMKQAQRMQRQMEETKQELEEKHVGELSTWQTVRPFCFSLIKGKRLPGSFQITLQLPAAGISRFVQESQVDFRPEQVGGLYLNIRYEEGVLHCVTGLSLKVFTLDRQMEQEWDQWVKGYLKGKGIPFSDV